MQVKDWNRDVISYGATIALLSRGPDGMQAPGDSGSDAGQGLEPKDYTYSTTISSF